MNELNREITEHVTDTLSNAAFINNKVIWTEVQVFGALAGECFSLLASQQFSKMITMANEPVIRLHQELGPYSLWDAPTKKGLGLCLAWYHIFQAMAWGSLEKGDLSLKHVEQALEVVDLPLHTHKLALDMKNQMAAIVEAEHTKKKGCLSILFGR